LPALAQPDSVSGGRRQTPKQTLVGVSSPNSPPFIRWFASFLREELKPYPGRYVLALRYTLAATITMLLIVTFRIPGATVGGFFSLLLSREAPITTLRGGISTVACFLFGTAFVLAGAILLVDYPLTHFLWVILSFFVAFYGLSALSNYGAGTAFAIVIVVSVPAWDQAGPQAALVVSNLWVLGAVSLAVTVTIVVEFAFSLFDTRDELTEGLDQRLEAVRQVLKQSALKQSANRAVSPEAMGKLAQFAMIGASRLRRLALHANPARQDTARLSTTVALVGRLVDQLAPFRGFDSFTPNDAPRLEALADQISKLQQKVHGRNGKQVIQPLRTTSGGPLILVGLEQTLDLLRMSISPAPGQSFALDRIDASSPGILKPDAFRNPEHLNFALRGCLASTLSYFIFNAVFWPGLNSALFTCVVTAVTSIGASRQKQLLRTSGAVVGGLLLGIGSQVLILPMLDTIAGFTVMFFAVTAAAAWFITSSPRLSYFGAQFALAFYFIQLRGPFPQTNLAIARDNTMGILLGLLMMWLCFETLGAKPAVQVMRELFAENLHLLGQLANLWPHGKPANLQKIRTLREKISQNFLGLSSQADAVLFEIGRSRDHSLAVRRRLFGWQPQLRSLFLMEAALLQYRLQVSPKDLPAPVLRASIHFDNEVTALFEGIARAFRLEDRSYEPHNIQRAYADLEHAILDGFHNEPPPRSQAVLAIDAQIIELACRLLAEIKAAPFSGALPVRK
jgi:multidrug resistance protein MdtO